MNVVADMAKPRTISTKVPGEWVEILEEYVIGPKLEYSNISEYLRDLVREDMKRRGLFHPKRGPEDEGKN